MNDSRPKKPRRRWYQYRLRTLLVVVLLASIGMSWFAVKMQQARRQEEAVAAVRKLGARVTYNYQEGDPYADPPTPVWLRRLLGDDFFFAVTGVLLDHHQVTDTEVARLKGLTQLQRLNLDYTTVKGPGLEHLKGLTRLQMLSVYRSQVTDAGLKHLNGMKQLESLDLTETRVTDVGLEHLKELTHLKWLWAGRLPGDRRGSSTPKRAG